MHDVLVAILALGLLGLFILYAQSYFRSSFKKSTVLQSQSLPKRFMLYALIVLNLIFILSTIFWWFVALFPTKELVKNSGGEGCVFAGGLAFILLIISVFTLMITLPFIRKLKKGAG